MLKNSNFHGRRISSAVIFGGASIAAAALTPFEGSAEQVCLEEVAGVCLKYRAAPPKPASPTQAAPAAPRVSAAERAENRLDLTRSERRDIQSALGSLGFYSGPIDGLFGGGTRRSISGWQASVGERTTGFLNAEQVRRLNVLTPAPDLAVAAPAQPQPASQETAAPSEPLKPLSAKTTAESGGDLIIKFQPTSEDGGDLTVRFTYRYYDGMNETCKITAGEEIACQMSGGSSVNVIASGVLPNVRINAYPLFSGVEKYDLTLK